MQFVEYILELKYLFLKEIKVKKIFYGLLFLSASVFAQGKNEVCLYVDSNYSGNKTCYTHTGYAIGIPFLNENNDTFSSVRVGSNVSLDGYEHVNYKGKHFIFTEDAPLMHIANDVLSSLVFGPRHEVCFYQHAYFGGEQNCFYFDGDKTIFQHLNKQQNDSFSSVKIPSGLRLTAYEHKDQGGQSWSWTNDVAWVGDANDRISSFVITEDK